MVEKRRGCSICWLLLTVVVVLAAAAGYRLFLGARTQVGTDGRAEIALTEADRDIVLAEMRALLGAVQGVTSALTQDDLLSMGLKTMAMIGIRVDGDRMVQIAEKIAELDEVIYLVVVSGRYDIFAEVFCRNHTELLTFLTEKVSSIPGVRETETFMHLKIVKEIYF